MANYKDLRLGLEASGCLAAMRASDVISLRIYLCDALSHDERHFIQLRVRAWPVTLGHYFASYLID